MPDEIVCIGSGTRPTGEHYLMVGPLEITEPMHALPPLPLHKLERWGAEFASRGGHLVWEDSSFHLYWQPNAEWPYRDTLSWLDTETVLVNYAALMKKWGLKARKLELVSNQAPIHDLSLCFVDIETTGLKTSSNKIIEISICRMRPGEAPEWYNTFVNPGRKIPTSSTEINKITDADVKNAPRFKAISQRVLELVSNSVLISHQTNAFDERFISQELNGCELNWQASSRLSTVTLAQALFPELSNYKLKTLATELGLPMPTHRAETDVKAMIALWEKLMQRASERSPALLTLGQLLSL